MNSENRSDDKRVVKNTLFLYMRMLLLLFVGLFTSRVVLRTLGVENYGIQSVIAGFLSMFSIITSSMSAAISRFITVELGVGNPRKLTSVFSTSMLVQIVMGVIVVIAIETIGIWFLNNHMNIPVGREAAARWCLHCATATTFLNLLNIPLNAAIIAHERMSAFAYMSILDAVFKLAICYAIYVSPFDKLKTYSLLLVIVSLIVRAIYYIYCLKNFRECRTGIRFHKKIFTEIWSFAGWNFFGNTAAILNSQGVNMLMNIFFGVIVNAARGVAEQANGIIQQFVTNFMMALNPQITKSYASGDKARAFQLSCRGAKFSFFIMFLLALPIMIEAKQILRLWLGIPPKQSVEFFILTVISTLILLLGQTLVTLQMAHGKIRKYQIWITVCGCLAFPLTYIAFKLGMPSVYAYFIYIGVYWFLLFVRFYLVHESTGIPARQYLFGVVFKCHLTGALSALPPLAVFFLMEESFYRLILVGFTSVLSSAAIFYLIGLETNERSLLAMGIQRLRTKLHC